MTDLTDFVNVMASAEDWLAAAAGKLRHRLTSPWSASPSTCRSAFIAGSRSVAPRAG